MIETLISIVLLGLIVVGSFYSYSFVHQRILTQRQQRIALGVLQGWMEKTSSYLITHEDTDDLTDSNVLADIENSFRQEFIDDVSTLFTPGISIDPNIALKSNGNDLIEIRIWATLNGLPICLYTELYTE